LLISARVVDRAEAEAEEVEERSERPVEMEVRSARMVENVEVTEDRESE
jgi:hypothetical protein